MAAATHAKSSSSSWGGPEHVSRRTPIALPLLSLPSPLCPPLLMDLCCFIALIPAEVWACTCSALVSVWRCTWLLHAPSLCTHGAEKGPWPAGPFYHDGGLGAICWGLQVLQATRKCFCERWRCCQWAWRPTGAWGLLVSGKAWDDLPFAAAEGKSRIPGSGVTTGCVLAPCPGTNWPWSQRKEEKLPVSQQGLAPGHVLTASTCDRAVPPCPHLEHEGPEIPSFPALSVLLSPWYASLAFG